MAQQTPPRKIAWMLGEVHEPSKWYADLLIQMHWAEGLEHGPVDYEYWGQMMRTMPFDEVSEMFAARYPILANEIVCAVYIDWTK